MVAEVAWIQWVFLGLIFTIISQNLIVILFTWHLWKMHLEPEKYGFGSGIRKKDLDRIAEKVVEKTQGPFE